MHADVSRAVEAFVAHVRALRDEDRVAVANARRVVDEEFHERALVAGLEILAGRGEEYVRSRRAVADVHLPESPEALGDDAAEIARLVQLAVDDALIAILTRDALHPNHLRELYRSLKAAAPRSLLETDQIVDSM